MNKTIITISIILPTFNESENIVPLVQKILSVLKKQKFLYEIIIIDDNSPDNTAQIARTVFRKNKKIRVLVRTHKKGLASAIAEGIKNAQGKYVVVMDTDFNHDPKEIPHFISTLSSCEFVIGSRFIPKGGMENKFRFIVSMFYNLFIRLYLDLNTTDNLSGFFAVQRKKILPLISTDIFTGFGEYFIRLIYHLHKRGVKIEEIPVYYMLRFHGTRKSQFIKMFITYSQSVFAIRR